MARYAVINGITGRVENIINWDGTVSYILLPSHYTVEVGALKVGQYVEGFSAPPEEVAAAKTERIAQIKAVAQERIYAIVPAWKQSNLNARMNELNMIRFEREWNESELAEIAAMNAIWQQVKAIRAASTEAENEVNQLTTIDGILEL